MKCHFGGFLSIAALLAMPLFGTSPAPAKTNLQLELVGPLVICETDTKLQIWVPDVHYNHNAPGFRAASSEYPLTYGPYKKYEMRLTKNNGAAIDGQMAINPPGLASNRSIAVYGERAVGGCKLKAGAASLSLEVPKPDSIWPEASADEIENVVGDNAASHGQFSNHNGGKYATRVVLRYEDIKPDTAVIYGGTTPYAPDVTPIGEEARISLEVSPQPESIPAVAHLQSAIAFEQMIRMMDILHMITYRPHLCYPMDGTQCPLTSLTLKSTAKEKGEVGYSDSRSQPTRDHDRAIPPGGLPKMSSTAKDCHAPLMLVCKSAQCNLMLQ